MKLRVREEPQPSFLVTTKAKCLFHVMLLPMGSLKVGSFLIESPFTKEREGKARHFEGTCHMLWLMQLEWRMSTKTSGGGHSRGGKEDMHIQMPRQYACFPCDTSEWEQADISDMQYAH